MTVTTCRPRGAGLLRPFSGVSTYIVLGTAASRYNKLGQIQPRFNFCQVSLQVHQHRSISENSFAKDVRLQVDDLSQHPPFWSRCVWSQGWWHEPLLLACPHGKTAREAHSPRDALQGCVNVPAWHCVLYPSRLSPKFFERAALAQRKKNKKRKEKTKNKKQKYKMKRKVRKEGEKKKVSPNDELNSSLARGA